MLMASTPTIGVVRVRNLKLCLLLMLLSSSVRALGPPQFSGLGAQIAGIGSKKCEPSLTTASGTHVNASPNAPAGGAAFCSGDLIFEDTFDTFDMRKWHHQVNTLAGDKNQEEFQSYTNNRSNTFCEEGFLHLRPTLTADLMGESFLVGRNQKPCASADEQPPKPVRSARLGTFDSFSFRYGKVEISAKLPAGDWLWPAIVFAARDEAYGSWPASGQIDMVEARGNRELLHNGINIGGEQITQTLRYGPFAHERARQTERFVRMAKPNAGTGGATTSGWSNDVHRYQMEWTPEQITFSVDDVETGSVAAGPGGFWARGRFDSVIPGADNPWRLASAMAPFDQEFYMIINLAVGGTDFFPDDAINGPIDNGSSSASSSTSAGSSSQTQSAGMSSSTSSKANTASATILTPSSTSGPPKPWLNTSPNTAARDFWAARNDWLPTWNLDQNWSREASLIVDYVRIWAL